MGILPRHADRDHHRLRHVRAAGVRIRSARAGEHRLGRHRGLARLVRGRGGAAHLAPRERATAVSRTSSSTGRTSPRWPARRRRGDRAHGLRGRRPGDRAGLARLLRRPALPRQPARRRRAVHVLLRARRPPPRALDLRGPVLGATAADPARGGARGRRADPRRRLLRPRRRAALQHARRDPRARGVRRHARVPDRRPGGRAVRRGGAAVRAARLRDRLRQRRDRRGDARADAAGHDGGEHGDRSPPCSPRRSRAPPAPSWRRRARCIASRARVAYRRTLHTFSAGRAGPRVVSGGGRAPCLGAADDHHVVVLEGALGLAAHPQLDAVPLAEAADALDQVVQARGPAGPALLAAVAVEAEEDREDVLLRGLLLEARAAAASAGRA